MNKDVAGLLAEIHEEVGLRQQAEADLSLLMRAVDDYRQFMRRFKLGMHPEMAPIVGALNEIEQRHPTLIEEHRTKNPMFSHREERP